MARTPNRLAKGSGKPRRQALNGLGLPKTAYRGRPSTLCKGCGHDSISQRIINVAWEQNLEQHQVVKMSGIGCSSKTPAYFLQGSHGFNSVHGRMPSVSTGAVVANRQLEVIGISGDGDTASIGIGQFKHAVRRNVPMIYIVENNGVYGLTKGQFSATADAGQSMKYHGVNELPPLDICIESLAANATLVARSFAGDPKQIESLLSIAFRHRGISVLDIISPCVTFNNHDQSTKSYAWGREHDLVLNIVDLVPPAEEIQIDDYESEVGIEMHDGSYIVLKKVGEDHDPTDKRAAEDLLEAAREEQKFITGLIYVNEDQEDLIEMLDLTDTPLSHLPDHKLRPSPSALNAINDRYAPLDAD